MIVVHAKPKTQPSGVQGALLMLEYQFEETPLLVNRLPSPNAVKFNTKKTKNLIRSFMINAKFVL